jgi:phosphate transport system ATP-binding protein
MLSRLNEEVYPEENPELRADMKPSTAPQAAVAEDAYLQVKELTAFYGNLAAVTGVNLNIAQRQATAIIGPSGCGKSTLLRCLNRMHEETYGGRVEGEVLLNGENIYGRDVDPVLVRQRIGMVFQKPNPFPTMSVFDNVVAGIRLNSFRINRAELEERAEKALRQAALWDEVKDKLKGSGIALSGGQQQRLCIARALAVEPDVLLMDEPCSALDPIATAKIEELIRQLTEQFTIVIVTHNMQQAARVSDYTAFLYLGELVEFGETSKLFTNPEKRQTEDYITGRFG